LHYEPDEAEAKIEKVYCTAVVYVKLECKKNVFFY